jgi:formylglycine-generating enzyme required for sulfatase activity
MSRTMFVIAVIALAALASVGCGESATTTAPSDAQTGPSPGEIRTDDKGVEQVWVPAGSFAMGSSDEQIAELKSRGDLPMWVQIALPTETPQHVVELTTGYWIDRYEVTNAAFQGFVDAGGYSDRTYWSDDGWAWLSGQTVDDLPRVCDRADAPDLPRVCGTWFEAEAYSAWRGGRLPTEAEWEYAARGADASVYPWGDEFDPANANVVDSPGSVAVGSHPAGVSWAGAHDMAGNAMEWVADWLDGKYYQQGDMVDPQGPATGSRKVEKGGWWGSNQYVARSAYRHYEDPPDYSDDHIGFRVVTP